MLAYLRPFEMILGPPLSLSEFFFMLQDQKTSLLLEILQLVVQSVNLRAKIEQFVVASTS